MFNHDLNEIGSVSFQLNFDNDYYNEWLSENGVTDSQQARFSFVRDCCDYDVEYTDSETYHHLGYATMTIDEIENVFGQKMAMDVLRSCMDGNEHTFEPLEYQNDEVDLNDPKQLSDAAMKYLKYGKYFKGARGFILPNGVVVYTDAEHNMCSRIPGVDGTFQFIELGCIRVLPNSLDMAKMPTTEQFNTIYQVLRCYEDSELYLDLMNGQIGNFNKKYSYYDPDDVVSDIERYFKGGNMRQNSIYENKNGVYQITREDIYRMVCESMEKLLCNEGIIHNLLKRNNKNDNKWSISELRTQQELVEICYLFDKNFNGFSPEWFYNYILGTGLIPNASFVAKKSDGNIIGSCVVTSEKFENSCRDLLIKNRNLFMKLHNMKYKCISVLAVDEEYRGTKLNADLVNKVIDKLKSIGCEWAYVEVFHHLKTHDYWKRWGAIEMFDDGQVKHYALPLK